MGQSMGPLPPQPVSWAPSLRGRQRAHSKSEERPVVQPVEEQNPEEPQVSRELDPEPPSSEQKLDLQPEPTVSFLFTLLSTAEPHKPKDPEEDLEIQEGQFLGKEDWGPQRTAKEINQLQNDCMRLWASLSTTQADNLALGEKLQSLPNSLYESLKEEVRAIQEDEKVIQEDAQAIQGAALLQVPGPPCSGAWGREGPPAQCHALSSRCLQQPSSQKTDLLIPQADVPQDHRNPRQPWPGPSLETGPDLGKTLQQLLSRSLQ
ncbi:uncharacterized protein LOC124228992 [Equus quagga]|uniref:uncharacterized protein LOC124228992 n=1 Tax=Equus quagga TaxID=89248 RepID=UPI001EE2EAB6|nr:uncharacterized protein LOC124228992 [Equus quagga]